MKLYENEYIFTLIFVLCDIKPWYCTQPKPEHAETEACEETMAPIVSNLWKTLNFNIKI